MKLKSLVLIMLVPLFTWSESAPMAPVAKPKESLYLNISIYEAIKNQLPKPPIEGSKAQQDDEKEIRQLQKNRTEAQCADAALEAAADLKPMFGPPKGPLTETEIQHVSSFLLQVRNEIGPFIGKAKGDFARKRPFVYLKDVNPCLGKDDSAAYPSGHGALSKMYALVLSDLFPIYKDKLEKRSIEIGKNRVIGGVHHPSDIEAGRKLAELLYVEIKKSKAYQDDFNSLKSKTTTH